MSASLVGSEMCIRDREMSAPTIQKLAAVAHQDGPEHPDIIKLSSLGSNAVSYTHLTLPTICSV
eukprot:1850913-Alexandrium_andersonii.AAC.1